MARTDNLQPPPPAPGQPAPQVVYVQAPKKKGKLKWIILGVVALFVIVAIASAGAGDDGDSSNSGGASSSSTSSSGGSSSLAPISYDQIVTDTEGLTDIQFDRYAEDIEGKRRADRWTATVLEVDDKVFGNGYYADLTIDPNSTFDLREMAITIDEATALSLSKGDEITFSGEIADLSNTLDILHIEIEDVTVHG